jgi:hypothetical protein
MDMNNLRIKRNRLIAAYFGFIFMFFSGGVMAGTGVDQPHSGLIIIALLLLTIPIIGLNISLHKAIRSVSTSVRSYGLKESVMSAVVFTPFEAAIILPAINLASASKLLRADVKSPNKSRNPTASPTVR